MALAPIIVCFSLAATARNWNRVIRLAWRCGGASGPWAGRWRPAPHGNLRPEHDGLCGVRQSALGRTGDRFRPGRGPGWIADAGAHVAVLVRPRRLLAGPRSRLGRPNQA